MYIGHRNQEYEYFMDGKLLNKVENEIDIGVKIDNSMKPGAQCREASRVTMAVLNQISGAFHYPDRITFLNLYKTYMLEYISNFPHLHGIPGKVVISMYWKKFRRKL